MYFVKTEALRVLMIVEFVTLRSIVMSHLKEGDDGGLFNTKDCKDGSNFRIAHPLSDHFPVVSEHCNGLKWQVAITMAVSESYEALLNDFNVLIGCHGEPFIFRVK